MLSILLSLQLCWSLGTSYCGSGCSPELSLFKNTWATSNSQHVNTWMKKLLPSLTESKSVGIESAESMNKDSMEEEDVCGKESALEFRSICFKLDATETWQYAEHESVTLEDFEAYVSSKFNALFQAGTLYSYDAFLDYNTAFLVDSLDPFIEEYQNENVNYLLLQWDALPEGSGSYQTFYSLLVHVPSSQIIFELVSAHLDTARVSEHDIIQSHIPRVTFLNYPSFDTLFENVHSQFDAIPVRIGRATRKLEKSVHFYTTYLDAEVLYETQVDSDIDGMPVSYVSLRLPLADTLEIGFFERPNTYTAQGYKVSKFEKDVMATHEQHITSPYCGEDIWMSNHYRYLTWDHSGYLENVLEKLKDSDVLYRISKDTYETASKPEQEAMKQYKEDTIYTLTVFEPGGHSIELAGFLPSLNAADVPSKNHHYCPTECGGKESESVARSTTNPYLFLIISTVLLTAVFVYNHVTQPMKRTKKMQVKAEQRPLLAKNKKITVYS